MIDGLALAALGIRVTVISERIETARMKGVKIIDVECSFTSTLRPATLVISKEWEKGEHMLKMQLFQAYFGRENANDH